MAKKLEAKVTEEVRKLFKEIEASGAPIWYQKISDRFTSGIPDYIFCYYGKFGAVELKKEGKKAEKHPWKLFQLAKPHQAFTLYKIAKAEGHALATDNVEDVRRLLNSMTPLNGVD